VKEFWSKRIQTMTPYTPGEQPKDQTFIKLNTNENPYPPSQQAQQAMQGAVGTALRLYPDPDGDALREAICGVYGLKKTQVFVGNGSDEVLAFAVQAFFDGIPPVVFPDITYSFYEVYAALFGVDCRTIPLDERFTIHPEDYRGGNGGVLLANPNAPTGIGLTREEIRALLEGNPDVVVLVDEAYVEFGGETALPLIDAYPNLLVVRTLSKSHALAGLRVGWAAGNENLIAGLNCVKNSFNSYTLDRLALAGAQAAIRDEGYVREIVSRIIRTREKTAARLAEMGFSVCPSQANFLFATHPKASGKALQDGLRTRGILVRRWDRPRISDYLRITIGTDAEMDALCAALKELIP